jgi:hypothetical protein
VKDGGAGRMGRGGGSVISGKEKGHRERIFLEEIPGPLPLPPTVAPSPHFTRVSCGLCSITYTVKIKLNQSSQDTRRERLSATHML